MRFLTPTLTACLLALAPAGAQDLVRSVELRTLEGVRPARLTGWSAGGPLIDGQPAPDDWIELVFADSEPAPGPWVVELAGGGWLPGAPGAGQGDVGLWRTPDGSAVPLNLLWLRRMGRGRLPAREESEKDLLWLDTGGGPLDRRSGWLLGWQVEGLEFEGVAGVQLFEWDRIAGLQLVDEAMEPMAGGVWLLPASGGKLLCRPRARESGDLVADLPWSPGWRIAQSALGSLRRRGAPFLELAELEPAVWEGPESDGFDWQPRLNRSVEGRPLRVGGREFATGFGTRVPTEIAFDRLGPGTFVARVGVDDEVGDYRRPQPVRFRVFLDDELLASSRPVSAGAAARELVVEVPREGRLRLVAEAANRVPFGGHADWLDPLFLPRGAGLAPESP